MRKTFILGLILALIIGTVIVVTPTSPSEAQGSTIYVKQGSSGSGTSWADAYGNLDTALSASSSGDQIWVAAGDYTPGSTASSSFLMKNGVNIYGGFPNTGDPGWGDRDAETNLTNLDGLNARYHVVTGNSNATIDGFTIKDGNANSSSSGNEDYKGPGLYCNGVTNLTVNNCVFYSNYGSWRGAVYTNSSNVTLTNCEFLSNSSGINGGGLYHSSGNVTLKNCAFRSNTAGYYGGAVCTGDQVTLINCTIVSNSCGGSYHGGGISNHEGGNSTIVNCIIWGNSLEEIYNGDGSCTVSYSDIEGGWGGTGNINSNPLLVGGNDFHLQVTSPCIDKGNNAASGLPSTDYEGDPRIIDGDYSGVATVDMGVDEYAVMPPPGNCLDFDGGDGDTTGDIVEVNSFSGFPATQLTVELWVKSDDVDKAGTPFSYATSTSVNNEVLLFDIRNLSVYVNNVSTGVTGLSFNDGRWNHMAVTWRSSDGQVQVYKNGELGYTGAVSSGHTIPSGGCLALAQEQDNVGTNYDETQALRGKLDEVRIWNVVRTGTEIRENMGKPIPGNTSNLVAYYRFNESSGAVLPDATAGGHNGTLVNMDDSDWQESYAMVRPGALPASGIGADGFTANWSHPSLGGTPTTYYLDVSPASDFSTFVSGYDNLNVGYVTSHDVTGLSSGTDYYCRIRAYKDATTGQSQSSETTSVTTSAGTMVKVYVTLQGGGRPSPAGWEVPLNIGFYPSGSPDNWFLNPGSANYYFPGTATAEWINGGTKATVTVGPVASGTYDITADSSTTLLNVKKGVHIE